MTPRTNKTTALLIDMVVILVPLVGHQEAARMLLRGGAPLHVANRTDPPSLIQMPIGVT